MSFTLSHVIQGARRAPEILSSETAAYIVLSLAEQITGAPREVAADSVLLHASGALVVADVPHCSAQESDECLRSLLAVLLECVSTATVSDALRHIANGDAKGPVALRSELHAALVPLNRSAARRALTRLHRRLGAQFADSMQSLNEPVAVSRRTRRRKSFEPSVGGEEIHVTLEQSEPQGDVGLRSEIAPTGKSHWHPAQTTPWQFNEAVPRPAEGTPIFGSLAVRERSFAALGPSPASEPARVSNVAPNSDAWQPACDERTEAEAPVALRHQAASRDAAPLPKMVEHDTQVDHPVAAKSGMPTLVRRSSRRSRVADLVQRFGNRKGEPAERAVAELYNLATSGEQEFGAFGTATPPPVARESLLSASPGVKHKPRRILLKTVLAVAPVIAFWVVSRPTPSVVSQSSTSETVPAECHATVRVSVPPRARVFLNDQQERQEQAGPIAVFQRVACSGQAEVTVRVPEQSGSKLPDAWVRVPLPEVDLTRAALQGRALEVEPLAH